MPLLIIAFGIFLQVFLTYKKVSPFLSLILVAIVVGILLGMDLSSLVVSVERGVGSTLGGLALILCFGGILGKLLENSGAIGQITTSLIKKFGERHVQWAVLLTGFLVGLPLYYNAGFVILVPLVFAVAKRTKLPLLYIAIPTAASLSATHCFLPPHPGPVVLVNAFGADLGQTLIYGLILVGPIAIISGPVLGRFLKNIGAEVNSHFHKEESVLGEVPSVGSSFIVALMPVILIAQSVFAENFLNSESPALKILMFLGDPNIALLLSVVFAVYFLGIKRGKNMTTLMQWVSDGVTGIAMILLIITAGGVLKQVLIDSGTGAYITAFSSQWQVNPLLFGWVITALLRVTLGSATVAALTAAGIVAPLVTGGQASPELMVLSVGAGSIFGSHINDTGFWMFKEFFNLSLKETFLSWTVMESVMSVLGLIGVLLLQLVIG